MRYKSLLLALLVCFSAQGYAADNTKDKKAPAKKAVAAAQAEKAAPKKGKDAATKKAQEPAKERAAKNSRTDNAAAKKGKAAEQSKAQAEKKADAVKKNNQADNKADKSKNAKNARDKAAAEPKNEKNGKRSARAEKNAEAAKNSEKTADNGKTHTKNGKKNPAEKTAADKRQNTKEAAAEKHQAAKETSAAKNVKNRKAQAAEAETKNAAAKTEDSAELRAAVAAATRDAEEKKALLRQSEALLIKVSTNLKELQQARINLADVNRQQRDAWAKFQKTNAELNRLKTEIANTRAQISRFVSGNYKNSSPNAVALFLKNAEPGQKTRFLRYTRYINQANEKVMADLNKQQKALAAQENRLNAELGRLKNLQSKAQAALKKQGASNTAEQVESRRQNAQMAKEAQKVVQQKANDQRLNNLLSDLEQRKAEQRKQEALARKKAAQARLEAAEKARKAEQAALSNLTEEDMKLKAPTAAAQTAANSFSRMQGRLGKPINGTPAGLFGQTRDSGGEVWRGVFYQAPKDSTVSSIAAGSVVYADKLADYGNVVVIDHGDNYVSVYSGLNEINVSTGYNVGAGNKLGTSGTLPSGEEGLYLEIRNKGRNMNPLSWIN
ncbi:peptidoglycan DD-metalloendopeptidase family protein [Neisseria sp. ZJ106]|uniref:Peptidoglycan DD-metalloendopeptidase family protein n=1 Tax=Neisseria lisongii TaxID=2912188 RepID=A0ABY7RL58_9NEIS|nr:peptidoglycan DD-metalloendopeptidase family protein [Neisseria lisongii]MCF7521062.1 peptidoglycan DD-metalloendopeptidase family protein [Neisseria lisongii]WCL71992.1 peptidoglycan DD-metalloendopeptidase family protein [Neisseria lisongii]